MWLYYPPFFPLSLICAIFILRVRERLVCESTNTFFNQEGSNMHLKAKFSSQTKILNEEHQHTSITSHSIFFTISHFTSKHSPLNIEHHFTRSTNSSWLSFHFAFKTLKFYLTLDLNIIFNGLACTIKLLHSCIQIEMFLSKFKFCTWNSSNGPHDKLVSSSI